MADLGSSKIGSNYHKLLQIDSTVQDGSGSNVSLNIDGHITASGNISSSGTGTNYFGGDVEIDNGADILLDEDQRIYFETDKQTWIESDGADLFRVVAGNSQMLLLDQDTGNRAVFGNGTKVYIGNDNNALPSNTLEVPVDVR